jgi:threonine dehydrogenase-like Zn-dependent dehydrogenase
MKAVTWCGKKKVGVESMRTGQTHIMRYMQPLLERIQKGEIDPSEIITHSLSLDDALMAYEIFKHKRDGCIKVIMKPHEQGEGRVHDYRRA